MVSYYTSEETKALLTTVFGSSVPISPPLSTHDPLDESLEAEIFSPMSNCDLDKDHLRKLLRLEFDSLPGGTVDTFSSPEDLSMHLFGHNLSPRDTASHIIRSNKLIHHLSKEDPDAGTLVESSPPRFVDQLPAEPIEDSTVNRAPSSSSVLKPKLLVEREGSSLGSNSRKDPAVSEILEKILRILDPLQKNSDDQVSPRNYKGLPQPKKRNYKNRSLSITDEGNRHIKYQKNLDFVYRESCVFGCRAKTESRFAFRCPKHNCCFCRQRIRGANGFTCYHCMASYHVACLKLPVIQPKSHIWYCPSCSYKQGKVDDDDLLDTIGNLPEFPTGTSWMYRIEMSIAKIHRPSMSGINGSYGFVARSIVIQGTYELDKDFGNEFFYTGAGGRDKRKQHVTDQLLSRSNHSLAATCDAEINEQGAIASDWRKSSPVRVIRGYKLKFQSPDTAPDVGFRYDGLYKLVQYWPEMLPSGFTVFRYYFRRDDPEPLPSCVKQTKVDNNSRKKLEKLRRVNMLRKNFANASRCPPPIDGYLDEKLGYAELEKLIPLLPPSMAREIDTLKLNKDYVNSHESSHYLAPNNPTPNSASPFSANFFSEFSSPPEFIIPYEIIVLIDSDVLNQGSWEALKSLTYPTLDNFLIKFKAAFSCGVCSIMMDSANPFTTPCGHNFCHTCIKKISTGPNGKCPCCDSRINGFPIPKELSPLDAHLNLLDYFNSPLSEIISTLSAMFERGLLY